MQSTLVTAGRPPTLPARPVRAGALRAPPRGVADPRSRGGSASERRGGAGTFPGGSSPGARRTSGRRARGAATSPARRAPRPPRRARVRRGYGWPWCISSGAGGSGVESDGGCASLHVMQDARSALDVSRAFRGRGQRARTREALPRPSDRRDSLASLQRGSEAQRSAGGGQPRVAAQDEREDDREKHEVREDLTQHRAPPNRQRARPRSRTAPRGDRGAAGAGARRPSGLRAASTLPSALLAVVLFAEGRSGIEHQGREYDRLSGPARVGAADVECETRPVVRQLDGALQDGAREHRGEVAARVGARVEQERARRASQGHAKVTLKSGFARNRLILLRNLTIWRILYP